MRCLSKPYVLHFPHCLSDFGLQLSLLLFFTDTTTTTTTTTNTTTDHALRTTHNALRPTQTDHAALRRVINTHKLRRFVLSPAELTPAAERARADAYLAAYVRALPLGADLPATELQPADDLVLLAAQAFVGLWRAEGTSPLPLPPSRL